MDNGPTPSKPPPRVFAVALPKGGVGKSTSAVNLAAAFARTFAELDFEAHAETGTEPRRVLLVDTDTQGQAAGMLGLGGKRTPPLGLADVLTGKATAEAATVEARPLLDVLAGGPELAGAAREIARRDFGGERMLAEALEPVATRYAAVILDTAPGWDSLSANVLFYAGELLAPVALDALALEGFARFVERVRDVQRYRPELGLRYVLPTMFDRRVKAPGEVLEHLRAFVAREAERGADVRCLPPIRYSVRLAEAPAHGETVFEYASDSTGAKDYAEAARIILDTPAGPSAERTP